MCRQGHASRIVAELKAMLGREGASYRRRSLLTQADDGEKARAFWAKQALCAGPTASLLVDQLHSAQPKLAGLYDGSTPMLYEVTASEEVAASRSDVGDEAPKIQATPMERHRRSNTQPAEEAVEHALLSSLAELQLG